MDDEESQLPQTTNAERTARLGRPCCCEVDGQGRVVWACPWCCIEFAEAGRE